MHASTAPWTRPGDRVGEAQIQREGGREREKSRDRERERKRKRMAALTPKYTKRPWQEEEDKVLCLPL